MAEMGIILSAQFFKRALKYCNNVNILSIISSIQPEDLRHFNCIAVVYSILERNLVPGEGDHTSPRQVVGAPELSGVVILKYCYRRDFNSVFSIYKSDG